MTRHSGGIKATAIKQSRCGSRGRALAAVGASVALLGLALVCWFAFHWLRISEQEVEFASGDLILRGTLVRPAATHRTPAVVLIHGSGETSRRSMMLYAKLFAVRGVTALTYDKRGVGASDGRRSAWREFDFSELAADAQAAREFLVQQPGVDLTKIGFFATSQGAWVASLAASSGSPPAFSIMVSASVSSVAEDRLFGRRAQLRHLGFGTEAADQAVNLLRGDHDLSRTGEGEAALASQWAAASIEPWFPLVHQRQSPRPADDPYRTWQRSVLDYDPRPQLIALDVPTLWIFGDRDLDRFAPVASSIEWLDAQRAAGKPYEVVEIQGASHDLKAEGKSSLSTLFRVRVPAAKRIFDWLDREGFAAH